MFEMGICMHAWLYACMRNGINRFLKSIQKEAEINICHSERNLSRFIGMKNLNKLEFDYMQSYRHTIILSHGRK
jgi:glutaredoxin-related protein